MRYYFKKFCFSLDKADSGGAEDSKPTKESKPHQDPDDALFSFEGFPGPDHLAKAEDRAPVPPIKSPAVPEDVSFLPPNPNEISQKAPQHTLKNAGALPASMPHEADAGIRHEEPYAPPEISSDELYRVESPKKLFKIDYLLAFMFGMFGFFAVTMTQDGIGFTWDEAYYVRPGLQTLEWFQRLNSADDKPLSHEETDQYFAAVEDIPELPMVPKILFAAGFYLHEKLNFDKPYLGMRVPIAVCFGLTLIVLYFLAGKYYARTGAILTVVCYMTIPRVFGHAHVAGTETILIFLTVLFVYCFVKGLDDWRWSILTGITFGLCLATKVNAIFLPFTLILWAHIFQRRFYANNVFTMLFISPLVMVLVWPWLWPDPFGRFMQYLSFFAEHKMVPVMFQHVKYPFMTEHGIQNVPWTYPFILAAFTTPTLVLILTVIGLARTLRNLNSHDVGVLFLLCVIFPLTLAAMPFTPKYDGVRLFLPIFPFVALLAGIGGEGIAARIRGFRTSKKRYAPARYFAEALALAIFGYGFLAISEVHPHELSYWNRMFGGFKGAKYAGMETTYWGDAVNETVYEYLNDLPPGTHVRPLALHDQSLKYLQEWNIIPKHLIIDVRGPGDVIIMQMREGFFGPEEQVLYSMFQQGQIPGQTLVEYDGQPFVLAFDLRGWDTGATTRSQQDMLVE